MRSSIYGNNEWYAPPYIIEAARRGIIRFRQGREWAENDLFRLGQMSPHETL